MSRCPRQAQSSSNAACRRASRCWSAMSSAQNRTHPQRHRAHRRCAGHAAEHRCAGAGRQHCRDWPQPVAASGIEVIDAGGKPLTPTLFGGVTAIGLDEVSAEDPTNDQSLALGQGKQMVVRPEFDVTPGLQPGFDSGADRARGRHRLYPVGRGHRQRRFDHCRPRCGGAARRQRRPGRPQAAVRAAGQRWRQSQRRQPRQPVDAARSVHR